tara:strand:+ start:1837 stop:2274 length:438 start_codon:yes stop_codon:yes gene_type:complete
MKNKLQYLIIGILLVSNIYFILNNKKSRKSNNSEFRSEMNYLKKRIEFDEDQLKLAVKEYKRYESKKKEIEKKLRKFDLIIMDDIRENNDFNNLNMNNYYEIAVLLNEERMNHWRKVREIANEDQIRKLDSIWSRMKDRIRSSSE